MDEVSYGWYGMKKVSYGWYCMLTQAESAMTRRYLDMVKACRAYVTHACRSLELSNRFQRVVGKRNGHGTVGRWRDVVWYLGKQDWNKFQLSKCVCFGEYVHLCVW